LSQIGCKREHPLMASYVNAASSIYECETVGQIKYRS